MLTSVSGVKSEDSVAFFDWETQTFLRRIEASPKAIYWSDDGSKVVLALEESAYLLKCNQEVPSPRAG